MASDFDLTAAAEAALATSNPVAGPLEQILAHSSHAHFGITSHDERLRSADRLAQAMQEAAVLAVAGVVGTAAELRAPVE